MIRTLVWRARLVTECHGHVQRIAVSRRQFDDDIGAADGCPPGGADPQRGQIQQHPIAGEGRLDRFERLTFSAEVQARQQRADV